MADWGHFTTSATSSGAASVLMPQATPREFALIYNNGTGPTYFGASNVSTSNGFVVAASGSLVLTTPGMANAALYAIAPTARTIHVLSK